MDVEEKIANAKRREEEENKINREIISKAILDLLTNFKYTYGTIKKHKNGDYLNIFVNTGGWSDNKRAVKKFNETQFKGATMSWFRDEVDEDCDSDEYDCYKYEWNIPLELVNRDIVNAKI